MFILVFASLLSGKYMFIEASSPRKLNDRALLASEMLPAGSASCFHFWYSMYGHDIYILRVWVRQNSNGLQVPIFELKGQQSTSPQWLQGQAPIPTQSDSFSVSCNFFLSSPCCDVRGAEPQTLHCPSHGGERKCLTAYFARMRKGHC